MHPDPTDWPMTAVLSWWCVLSWWLQMASRLVTAGLLASTMTVSLVGAFVVPPSFVAEPLRTRRTSASAQLAATRGEGGVVIVITTGSMLLYGNLKHCNIISFLNTRGAVFGSIVRSDYYALLCITMAPRNSVLFVVFTYFQAFSSCCYTSSSS